NPIFRVRDWALATVTSGTPDAAQSAIAPLVLRNLRRLVAIALGVLERRWLRAVMTASSCPDDVVGGESDDTVVPNPERVKERSALRTSICSRRPGRPT